MKLDYLDIKNDVLYCSKKCAIKNNVDPEMLVPIDSDEFEERYKTGDHWGTLCPTCENEYNNY